MTKDLSFSSEDISSENSTINLPNNQHSLSKQSSTQSSVSLKGFKISTKDKFVASPKIYSTKLTKKQTPNSSKNHNTTQAGCGEEKDGSFTRTRLNNIFKKIFKMSKTQNAKNKVICRDEYDRQEKLKYRSDYILAPQRRTSNKCASDGSTFYLAGGVSVEHHLDIQSSEIAGTSKLNDFVQVLGAEIFEKQGYLEVKLQNTQPALSDFSFVAKQFQQVPPTSMYSLDSLEDSLTLKSSEMQQEAELGQEIERYGQFIQQLLKRKEMCANVEGFSKFSEIVSNQGDAFTSFVKEVTTRFQYHHPIFSYRVYKFDLIDFEFKLKAHGYSEEFIKTIGYDNLNAFKDRVMHQGLPEVYTLATRQNLAKTFMQAVSKKQTEIPGIECRLLSLDSLEVETKLDMHLFPFYDARTPIFNSLFDCSAVLEVCAYRLSKDTLRELIQLRRKLHFDFTDSLKQDIYYELQSQIFVDTFYANSPLKIKKLHPMEENQKLQTNCQKNGNTQNNNSQVNSLDSLGITSSESDQNQLNIDNHNISNQQRTCKYRLL